MSNIRSKALAFLSRRALSTHRMRKKLGEAGFEEEAIEPVIQELMEWGYLNDQQWLKNFFSTTSKGPIALRYKLRQEGFSDEEIAPFFEEQEPLWEQEIERVIQKKGSDLSDPKQRQRLVNTLLRQGFTWDSIREKL